jgi:hypothetical protein
VKLKYDDPLSNFAFKFNLRRFNKTDLDPDTLDVLARLSLGQGLTLVHFSAQLEPCLTHKNTRHPLNTP